MSLADWFRPAPTERPPLGLDDARRLGRLEAEVERLSLQWVAYRDELKRLVNRLEKREQRAEERAQREADAVEHEPDFPAMDETSRRVLARRNATVRNGLPE